MTDIHSHILFDVDDGSKSIEESIELLKKLKKIGFNNVILTPHYIKDSEYSSENKEKKQKINELKEELINQNIDINIFLGNEIFINNEIYDLIKEGQIHTLNNTRYILVELPFHNEIVNLEDIIYELKIKGLIPIIAHPERYSFVKKDYKWVIPYIEMGVLFQGDYESLFGKYGNNANKTLRKLLKKNFIHFLGSDMHHKESSLHTDEVKEILKKLIKDDDKIEDILNNNFDKVIKNKTI